MFNGIQVKRTLLTISPSILTVGITKKYAPGTSMCITPLIFYHTQQSQAL